MKSKYTLLLFLVLSYTCYGQFETLINRQNFGVNIKKTQNRIFIGETNWPKKIFYYNQNLTQLDSIIAPNLNNYYPGKFCAASDSIIYISYGNIQLPISITLRTVDSGMNWDTVSFSSSLYSLGNIYMTDKNHGVASSGNSLDYYKIYYTSNAWQTKDSLNLDSLSIYNFVPVSNYGNTHFLLQGNRKCIFTKDFFNSYSIIEFDDILSISSGKLINQDSIIFINQIFDSGMARYSFSFNSGETFNHVDLPFDNYWGGFNGVNYYNGNFLISTYWLSSSSNNSRILISNNNFQTFDELILPYNLSFRNFHFINDSIALLGSNGKIIIKWNMSSYTSIKKQHKEIGLSIFPNPTNAIVNIVSSKSNINKIEVLDIAGKQIKFNVFQETNQIEENISKYENGIYILKIFLENGDVIINKIVKH